MKFIFNENNNLALTIGGALIFATLIGGIFYATKSTTGKDILTVTGSARKEVVADTVSMANWYYPKRQLWRFKSWICTNGSRPSICKSILESKWCRR
jgi:hypothetical protein